ncbi:fasciclin domain-containing protein [Pedobacter xixiisoli]|uniref:Fasciclin domain-containing protein n=2 Tax=Pedobacter xixiisoli TaxID=1476464 RepID=A0A285ZUP7_9SPHI|nr:fasciclin domain-containing protein [Pedobacter xixiisoli]SOD13348.1 Fasciclin domain-containing protein [Pedobacter xixiisoli]
MALCMLLLAACKHDDLTVAAPNENVRPAGDFVKNNYEMRLFSAALQKTDYFSKLNAAGPFTVLAPTDAAFNALGIYSASDFDKMNQDSLKKVIGYHILPRRLRVDDIPSNGIDVRYTTLEGSDLYVSRASFNPNGGVENETYFSGAEVTRTDVQVANGTLHLLGSVMKPNFTKNIQQWLAERAEYSVFVQGLKKFSLWNQLAGQGSFTVFAPSNAALEEIGITSASIEAMDINKYVGERLFGTYLMHHRHFFVSDAQVFSRINSSSNFEYILNNDSYYMTFSASKAYPTFKLAYWVSIRAGKGGFDPVITSGTGDIVAKNDNLCSNGIVHHMVTALLSPAQAIKQ